MIAITTTLSSMGYARANGLELVEPQSLYGEISKWVILDARPKAEWAAGHIPGAFSFSWENFTRTDDKGVDFRVFPAIEIADALGKMGIDEETAVAIYGDADTSWGGEGWNAWVLRWLGHKGPVRLLAGGIQAWKEAQLPLTPEDRKIGPNRVVYRFELMPQVAMDTVGIKNAKSDIVLIDTRSTMEWLKGRIPGAIHIEWTEFYTGSDRRPLDGEALKKLLHANGANTDKPVVYYCRGGVRSAYAWMVHGLSGLPEARNYEGGMEEWQRLSGE